MSISKEQFSLSVALVVKSAFDDGILEDFIKETGLEPVIDWSPTTVIMRAISNGIRPDGVIITDDALADLVEDELVDTASVTPLVVSKVGVGVLKGSLLPDISTVEAFKKALLSARSVAYSMGGQSGLYFAPLLERLGIADQINARATRIPSGFSAEKLCSGEADLAVQQISELLAVEGTQIVGPFPEEVQKVTTFSGAALTESVHQDQVRAFLSFLRRKAAADSFMKFGLDLQ